MCYNIAFLIFGFRRIISMHVMGARRARWSSVVVLSAEIGLIEYDNDNKNSEAVIKCTFKLKEYIWLLDIRSEHIDCWPRFYRSIASCRDTGDVTWPKVSDNAPALCAREVNASYLFVYLTLYSSMFQCDLSVFICRLLVVGWWFRYWWSTFASTPKSHSL